MHDRRRFIGGSDIAGILGISPWATPLDIYFKKTAPELAARDPERERFFKRRKRQEPIVAEILADEYGFNITKLSTDEAQNRYVDEKAPYFAAEIDFECELTDGLAEQFEALQGLLPSACQLNGEIKTVHPFKAHEWGEQGSEQIPPWYEAQAQWGLGVTGRRACMVAALFGVDAVAVFPIVRDEETIQAMRDRAFSFWNEHVLKEVPPDPVNLQDIKRLYTPLNGRPVEISLATYGNIQRLDQLRGELRAKQFEIETLEDAIAQDIVEAWGKPADVTEPSDKALLLVNGTEVASWKRTRGVYLDQKKLKAEHPEIIAQYNVEHFYRSLRIKKVK